MPNIFDYIKWRGDLSFRSDPPNEIDALVFSGLSYICFGPTLTDPPVAEVTLREAARETLGPSRSVIKNDLELLKAASESDRFGNCILTHYVDRRIQEEETQFAAISFLLDDGSAFLAFRGTDDSLVGWKEDFNMSFQESVPAQRLAVSYVESFAQRYAMPIRLGGHSKGGNLAVYAGARVDEQIQRRILRIYNNDGPGFGHHMMTNEGYLRIIPKIRTFVPQSSVIGMLLEHEEPYTVIRSDQVSLLQHDFYSWRLMADSFIRMEDITADSRFLDRTIKNWIAEMTPQERNTLVDALFGLLESGDVSNAVDIFHPRNIRHYLKALSSNGNMRKLFTEELRSLVSAARKARAQFAAEDEH